MFKNQDEGLHLRAFSFCSTLGNDYWRPKMPTEPKLMLTFVESFNEKTVKKSATIVFLVLILVSQLKAEPIKSENQGQVTIKADSIEAPLEYNVIPAENFNFWEERFKGNWAGIFFGFNGLGQPDYSAYSAEEKDFMEPTLWQSNSLNINLIQASIRLQRNRNFIGLVSGIGAEFQSYRLHNNYSLQKTADHVDPVYLTNETNLKSKFSSVYLTSPLLIEFQIPVGHYNNRFYFSTGIIGSLRLDTHTKIKYRADDKRKKLKEPDDYFLRDFRLSGTVRMGYRWINLFASYDLQPFFKDGKGPELYPFSIGVGLITF